MQLRTLKTGAAYSDAKHVFTVCASTALTPTVRRKVDLPDMLDPVMIAPLPAGRTTLLGIASGRRGCRTLLRCDVPPASRKRGRVQSSRSARIDATLIAASIPPA